MVSRIFLVCGQNFLSLRGVAISQMLARTGWHFHPFLIRFKINAPKRKTLEYFRFFGFFFNEFHIVGSQPGRFFTSSGYAIALWAVAGHVASFVTTEISSP